MIVKYVKERGYEGSDNDPLLTLGREYIVLGIDFSLEHAPEILIVPDCEGTPGLFSLAFFKVVDAAMPSDYHFKSYDHGLCSLYPKELYVDFWDHYHDDEPEAVKILDEVIKKIKAFHLEK